MLEAEAWSPHFLWDSSFRVTYLQLHSSSPENQAPTLGSKLDSESSTCCEVVYRMMHTTNFQDFLYKNSNFVL